MEGKKELEGPTPYLAVMTLPPGATTQQARLVFDGIRGAIFFYDNTGALVGSWAISAGNDGLGHSYPQGLSVNQGTFTLGGGAVTINDTGVFIYRGAPALNTLMIALASVSGTDIYGNSYPQGMSVFMPLAPNAHEILSLTNVLSGGFPGFSMERAELPPLSSGGMYGDCTSAAGAITLTSGQATGADNPSDIVLANAAKAGPAYPFGTTRVDTGIMSLGGWLEIDGGPGGNPSTPSDFFSFTAGASMLGNSPAGMPIAITNTDSNTYNFGRLVKTATSQTVNTVAPVTLFTFNVTPGRYKLTSFYVYQSASASGTPVFSVNLGGGAVQSLWIQDNTFYTYGNPAGPFSGSFQGAPGNIANALTLTAGVTVKMETQLWVTITTGGTVIFTAAVSGAGLSFVLQRSSCRLEPVT